MTGIDAGPPTRPNSRLLLLLALALSAVLCAGAAFALVSVTDDDRGTTTAQPTSEPTVEPTESPTPVVVEPTESPTPSPSASPSATASTSATATPASTATPTGSTATGPYPHPSPTRAYAPLAVSASLSPSVAKTFDSLSLQIRATDGDGTIRLDHVAWGDGATYTPAVPSVSCSPKPSPSTPTAYDPDPDSYSAAFSHAWRTPGTYTVTVEVVSGGTGCEAYPPKSESRTATVRLVVGDSGSTSSNGEAPPTVRKVRQHDQRGLTVSFTADPYDTDGWVTRAALDFGDGSGPVTHNPGLAGCDDGNGTRYPGTQAGQHTETWTHTFPRHGTYTLTFDITSTGCDGKSEQSYLTKVSVTV